MLPKKGRKLPAWSGVLRDRETYAQTISELLHKEHGQNRQTIKLLMRQTHASERTVKHWLSGQHGPDTVFFLRLMVSSPVIRAFVLGLIDGPVAKKLAYPVERVSIAAVRTAYAVGEMAKSEPITTHRFDDPINDPVHDPMVDPEPTELNERQYWFLARIAVGVRLGANEIVSSWQVSLKTARRDIASLKAAGLIQFIGSRRKGRYHTTTPLAHR